jgi:hypothetical protein
LSEHSGERHREAPSRSWLGLEAEPAARPQEEDRPGSPKSSSDAALDKAGMRE